VEKGRVEIERVAHEHDREIDHEHYGALIPYAHGPLPDPLLAGLKQRRPDLDDVSELVPQGWNELQRMIRRFVDVGFSKFVVLPIVEPRSADEWVDHLGVAAGELLTLQT
jgi:hypothetical protein